MKQLPSYLFLFAVLFGWLSGIAIAKGFWSTLFAIFFPPYAWYLPVEKIVHILLP